MRTARLCAYRQQAVGRVTTEKSEQFSLLFIACFPETVKAYPPFSAACTKQCRKLSFFQEFCTSRNENRFFCFCKARHVLRFQQKKPRFFFLSLSLHAQRHSSMTMSTRITSSPMRTILHHGMTTSSVLDSPSDGQSPTTSATMRPSQVSNSMSVTKPRLVPSRTLMTSFCPRLVVEQRSVKSPPVC